MKYLIIVFVLFFAGCQREVVYVDDSMKITILNEGDLAPFRGVLITESRYWKLLDIEDAAIQKGCWP